MYLPLNALLSKTKNKEFAHKIGDQETLVEQNVFQIIKPYI